MFLVLGETLVVSLQVDLGMLGINNLPEVEDLDDVGLVNLELLPQDQECLVSESQLKIL